MVSLEIKKQLSFIETTLSSAKKGVLVREGFCVVIVGPPNAGKSTLLNKMVGSKVSIVTHKVQTTRTRIRGIAVHDNSQLVFVDTPGLFETKRRLD